MSEEAVWKQNGGRLLIETPVVARYGPAGWEKYPLLRLSPCLLYTNIHKYTLKNRSHNLGSTFPFFPSIYILAFCLIPVSCCIDLIYGAFGKRVLGC